MKFGLYLRENIVDEWKQYYIQYDELKRMIRVLAAVEGKSMQPEMPGNRVGFSLTVPPPTNDAAQPRGTAMEGKLDNDSDGKCILSWSSCWA